MTMPIMYIMTNEIVFLLDKVFLIQCLALICKVTLKSAIF